MHEEVERQEDVLTRVTDHVDRTQDGLSTVQASAEKTLGKKGTSHLLFSNAASDMRVVDSSNAPGNLPKSIFGAQTGLKDSCFLLAFAISDKVTFAVKYP